MKARDQLIQWLTEREVDVRLQDDVAAPVESVALRYDLASPSYKPGDVYILKPSSGWAPVYVLIIEKSSDDVWLAVPFGRYATPAVPGEWSTGLRVKPLRVLCFWNAREVHARDFVGPSAKQLSEKQLQDAVAVYQHVISGDALEDRLSRRLGPPVIHPLDPRYAYLDEERARLDDHVSGKLGDVIALEDASSAWLMAAEGRPGYGK